MPARPAADHAREEGPAAVNDTQQVDRDDLLPASVTRIEKQPADGDPGIVDDDVHLAGGESSADGFHFAGQFLERGRGQGVEPHPFAARLGEGAKLFQAPAEALGESQKLPLSSR